MKKNNILIVGSDFSLFQNIQSIIEDEDYDLKFISIFTIDLVNYMETNNIHLVLIDIDEEIIKCIHLGQYLLNEDLIPFCYLSSNADSITIEKVKRTRPYGFFVKPFREMDMNASLKLIFYNYLHKNIDLLKNDKKIIEDVPYRIRHVINYINENINEKIDF